MKTLPILNLDDLSIAKPCDASWEQMTPVGNEGEKARHCGSCDKNVYRIAAMSRAEATALILKHEGSVCLRMARRDDGTVITNDCPVGVARWRKQLAKVGAMATAAFGAVFGVVSYFGAMTKPTAEPIGITTAPTLPITPMIVEPTMPVQEPMGIVTPTRETMGKAVRRPRPVEKMGAVAAPQH